MNSFPVLSLFVYLFISYLFRLSYGLPLIYLLPLLLLGLIYYRLTTRPASRKSRVLVFLLSLVWCFRLILGHPY